jgi:hypothetical protein
VYLVSERFCVNLCVPLIKIQVAGTPGVVVRAGDLHKSSHRQYVRESGASVMLQMHAAVVIRVIQRVQLESECKT